jgi:cytoskeletal protein CcmA (bactofilin family)
MAEQTPEADPRKGDPTVSFFGNNPRPDLKPGAELSDRGARGSDARFLGEVHAPESDLSAPTFTGDPRVQPSQAPTPPERCTNVIATGARWKGNLKVDDSVRIDGHFSGEIDAKGTVQIAEGAEVDAKIHAAFVVVSGSLKGEIKCDHRVELMPRSRVSGEVITKALSIHEGATLDGGVQMTSDTASRINGSRARITSADAEPAAERRNGRAEVPTSTE